MRFGIRDIGVGYASSGPRTAVLVSNPLVARLMLAHARRQARRIRGLTPQQREALLAALSKQPAR